MFYILFAYLSEIIFCKKKQNKTKKQKTNVILLNDYLKEIPTFLYCYLGKYFTYER